MKITLATLLAAGLLAACGDNSDDEVTDVDTPEDNEEELQVDDNETDGVEEDSEEKSETDEETDSNDGDSVGSGSFEDQEDLSIGDTAEISTNTGEYEITINSVTKEEEVDGQTAQLSFFILADVTVNNLSNDTLNAEDAIDILELTYDLDASGTGGDFSHLFDSIEGLSGELNNGEELSGEIIFESDDDDEMYIRVNSGLVASGAVHNNAVWKFDISEAE